MEAAHDVTAVVTRPDRPAGRGLEQKPSAIKKRATELGLPVLTPERLDDGFIASIKDMTPQLLACVSYGKILPAALLEIPGMTALNVHPSMLPEYRGAAPIQAALRDGRERTGVTIIWMSTRMDAGDIALAQETTIEERENYGTLHDRLAILGSRMLADAAVLAATGALPRTPQDETLVTFAKPISKDDLRVDERSSAKQIVDLVRSASPSPAAWTIFDGKRLKVLEARAEAKDEPAVTDDGPSIPASDGIVRLLRVVPEGKAAMTGAQFARVIAKHA
jgi:methionyl-tRNA formyltransferase